MNLYLRGGGVKSLVDLASTPSDGFGANFFGFKRIDKDIMNNYNK